MKLGVVQGKVVLGTAIPEILGMTLLIVEPVTSENLREGSKKGGGKALVAVDQLGANVGQMVAFVEGRESANPYWPDEAPIDAYCSLIVNRVDYTPPAKGQK